MRSAPCAAGATPVRTLIAAAIAALLMLAAAAPHASASSRVIAAGASHTCAITSEGAAKCWGKGGTGQLGYGLPAGASTPPDSSVPVQVSGLGSGVTGITARMNHTCAIVSGAARCWGSNTGQQLGSPLGSRAFVPAQVTGLTRGVTRISTGVDHTCAVQRGKVKCWGTGEHGRLGNGGIGNAVTPADVVGLPADVESVAAGDRHSCALVAGAAYCWGDNSMGQLGNGTITPGYSTSPTPVTGLGSGVSALAAGPNHTCAVQNGAVRCWGAGQFGVLGSGGTDSATPVAVAAAAAGAGTIAGGSMGSCAVVAAQVACWGDVFGLIGNDTTGVATPLTEVTVGFTHACVVAAGTMSCWGANDAGQLGALGIGAGSNTPVAVGDLGPILDPSTIVDDTGGDDPGPPGGGDGGTPPGNDDGTPTPPGGSHDTPHVPRQPAPPVAGIESGVPALLSARRSVRAGRSIAVRVTCPDTCKLVRVLTIGKKKVKGVRAIRLSAGEAQKAKFKLPSKAVREIRKALRKKGKKQPRITLTLTPTNKAGKGKARMIRVVR